MQTLLVTKSVVERILTPDRALRAVEQAFTAYGMGQAQMPPKSYVTFANGDLRAMPAYLHGQGLEAAGIKSVNVHPGNRAHGLPTVMAVVLLIDPGTGFPLAIMDGTHLTALRTGAAGALAVKLLSRPDARVAGFVGAGVQARTQLACTLEVRALERIKVWQQTPESRSAQAFARWAEETFHLETSVHAALDEVTTDADIVITTTPSRRPLVHAVSPGTHINAIGADAPGKQEIDPALVKRCTIVVDDWSQASHSGEINVPFARGQIREEEIHAELGRIAAGTRPGRSSAEEITLFDSTGLAIQDVACAQYVYRSLSREESRHVIDLFK